MRNSLDSGWQAERAKHLGRDSRQVMSARRTSHEFLNHSGRRCIHNNFGLIPSVGSDSHLPLERLRSTVHSAIMGESPTHGKPGYLSLWSDSGALVLTRSESLRLDRFRSFFTTGATSVRLLDTPNTTFPNGPCHRLSCTAWQSPDMQDRVCF